MNSIVIISGPTASGKTWLAIELCKRLSGEVVNADSVQVFRGFDIGSAKPRPEEMAEVRHHLIDILSPEEKMDADLFRRLADEAIEDIVSRGKIPFVVGGTGFYIKSLLFGLMPSPKADPEVRRRINAEGEKSGWQELHRRLATIDSAAAAKIAKNDRQRIQRALEFYEITGMPISTAQDKHKFRVRRYRYLHLALNPPRELLNKKIEARADEMIKKGLIEEVKALLEAGISIDAQPMRSHGYSHAIRYLNGELEFEKFLSELKRDHRRYAKRQLTWLNKQPDVVFLSFPINLQEIQSITTDFINK
ncbi:MAG: tRNA (adenosine(37)-N6)-dimethylallyltransferase MiaA [Myxococcota bacterium]